MVVSDLFRRRKAESLRAQALRALHHQEFARAEALLVHSRALDPSVRGVHVGLARALQAQGKVVEAARALAEASRRFPGDDRLRLDLAFLQAETGQFWSSEHVLEDLVEKHPESPRPLHELCLLLRDTRQLTRLRARLTAALADRPDDAELVGLMAQLLLAEGARAEADAWWARARDLARAAGTTPPAALPGTRAITMRERLLDRFGVALLGTGHDDGVSIPWYSTYLCSNYDVVVTVARLRALAVELGWSWSGVCPIDDTAAPLAHVIAAALERPIVTPEDGGDPLAVAGILAPGWHEGPRGAWAQARAEAGAMFAFCALHYHAHPVPLPPIVGVAAGDRVCLPWRRLGEARIGFQRRGLIEALPEELDPRPPEAIARDYLEPLDGFAPQASRAAAFFQAHVAALQEGLQARCRVARIAPTEPTGASASPPDDPIALLQADALHLRHRALHRIEESGDSLDPAIVAALEDSFAARPELRARIADTLYRVAPARFGAFLEEQVAGDVPLHERDNLLHLYGCNPWSPTPRVHLDRWLRDGALTTRSEIVQSKYGLYLLEEGDGPAFAERLAGLLAGPTTLTLGVLHWLHDNPRVADYAPVIAPLLADPRPDVVFEALQSLRMAGHAPPLCELVALMERFAAHPRVVASAVELLERYAYDDALPRARPHLHGDDPDLVWAAVRALVRGEAPARGGQEIAARLAALAPDEPGFSAILRALLGVDQLAPLLPALAELRDVARVKALVSALGPTMIDLDDPRLVEHIRQDPDCYALNPPPGFASFLRRHGDPERDHATVYGAMGATHPRAGYEAMAVLARWGDAALYRQLLTATSYAPEHAEPALEALFCAYGSDDFDRLAAPLTERRDRVDGTLWAILRAIADDPARAPTLRAWVASQWQREAEVRRFIEVQLRAELPSAFVAGAQSAHFEVAARLLPGGLDELEARLLGGAPDRLALDLLEHLAKASPERAREHAARLQGSGHYGVRACARRLLASR